MKSSTGLIVSVTTLLMMSGCVTTSEFKAYKDDMDQRLAMAKMDRDILFCESQVDAYEDMIDKDEPDPSRRDEPTTSRRDLASCQAEYNDLAGANVAACATPMETCIDADTHSNQTCRTCYVECLGSGTWPVTGTPACPE